MSYMKAMKPNVHGRNKEGYYHPVNPLKYISDNKTIIYRSSLERDFCVYCDTDPTILRWISEPDFLKIKYVNPFKKKISTYYPDFYIQFKTTKGIVSAIIEIKADSMINMPKHGDVNRMSNFVKRAFVINNVKKKAAEIECAKKGMIYLVITEKSPFFKKHS